MPLLVIGLMLALGILLLMSFWSVLVISIGLVMVYSGLKYFAHASGWIKWLQPLVIVLGACFVISQWKFALFVTLIAVGLYYWNNHRRHKASNSNIFEYKS